MGATHSTFREAPSKAILQQTLLVPEPRTPTKTWVNHQLLRPAAHWTPQIALDAEIEMKQVRQYDTWNSMKNFAERMLHPDAFLMLGFSCLHAAATPEQVHYLMRGTELGSLECFLLLGHVLCNVGGHTPKKLQQMKNGIRILISNAKAKGYAHWRVL